MTLTDRSRIISYKSCNRLRFLQYHCRQTGIVQLRTNIALSTGSSIHRGVELLLKGCEIDKVIELVIAEYTVLVKSKQLELEGNEDQLFVFNEQKALIEALIRTYYLIQYPKIVQEYEILEVEKEIEYQLAEDTGIICCNCKANVEYSQGNLCPFCGNDDFVSNNIPITLMSRPDAIFRDKSTSGLVVYSLKTASSWPKDENGESYQEKKNQRDDQGLSELISTEFLMNEEVEAIKMDFLIKGARKWIKFDGVAKRITNSYILHPMQLDTTFDTVYSLNYTKAKGWKRIHIWEHISIKEWVDFLFENNYKDLQAQIITPYNYLRSTEDIQNWIEQNSYQEQQIIKHLEELKTISPELLGAREVNQEYKTLLNRYFPQNRESCYNYNRKCSYDQICFEGVKSTSAEYEARQGHHEAELVQLKGSVNV